MLTIEINNPKVEANYSKKEILNLLNIFIKDLEDKEKIKLYEIDYTDLTDDEKADYNHYKNMNEKELMQNFVNI